jgi:hypothetical protein
MRKVIAVAIVVVSAMVSAGNWAADPLERLFFTPAQRKALDAGKYASPQSAPVKPSPKTVHLDGVVTRSDADRTIWINGKAYHGGSPDGVQVNTSPATPSSTSIRIPGKTASSRVKVGQQLDLNSGQIREDFSRREGAAQGSAPPVEAPADRPVAGGKSAMKENAVRVTGDKDGDPPKLPR